MTCEFYLQIKISIEKWFTFWHLLHFWICSGDLHIFTKILQNFKLIQFTSEKDEKTDRIRFLPSSLVILLLRDWDWDWEKMLQIFSRPEPAHLKNVKKIGTKKDSFLPFVQMMFGKCFCFLWNVFTIIFGNPSFHFFSSPAWFLWNFFC